MNCIGTVSLAINRESGDLRMSWSGKDNQTAHGLCGLAIKNDNRPSVEFLGFDPDTLLLEYSFAMGGENKLCSVGGGPLTHGKVMRIDRRESTHGVPTVREARETVEVESFECDNGNFAVVIPENFLQIQVVGNDEEPDEEPDEELDDQVLILRSSVTFSNTHKVPRMALPREFTEWLGTFGQGINFRWEVIGNHLVIEPRLYRDSSDHRSDFKLESKSKMNLKGLENVETARDYNATLRVLTPRLWSITVEL